MQASLQQSKKSVGHKGWHTWHARALALKQASISSRLAARAFLCSVSCFSAAKSAALSENSTAHDHASTHTLLQLNLQSGHNQSSCQQLTVVTHYTHYVWNSCVHSPPALPHPACSRRMQDVTAFDCLEIVSICLKATCNT